MHRRPPLATRAPLGFILGCLFATGQLAWTGLQSHADSTVVFNEIMYHPPTAEAAMEWLELHNQMSVNMDISNWSLTGGIEYRFAEGTVVPGGGYLLVAINPAALQAATGATPVLGPFTGRLSNSGETLELRNNNQRLMDSIRYRTQGDWPVAPDGSGVSLAKRAINLASEPAENWRASAQMGGTPGAPNFPTAIAVDPITWVGSTQIWRVENSGADPGANWRGADFDAASWTPAQAPFYGGDAPTPGGDLRPIPTLFNTGVGPAGQVLPPGSLDPHYLVTASAQPVTPPTPSSALVIEGHPAWLANDEQSSWIGPVNPGSLNAAAGNYRCRTTFDLTGFDPTTVTLKCAVAADNRLNNILINGASRARSFAGYAAFSSDFTFNTGFVTGTNTLEFLWANDGPGANPAGFRTRLTATARTFAAPESHLTPVQPVTYFRTSFVVSGNPANTQLSLVSQVNDGAVFHLNGVEVARINLPSGPLTRLTPALSPTAAPPAPRTTLLPPGALKPGTNLLTAELHQADDGLNAAWFAAELTARPLQFPTEPEVVLNEIAGVGTRSFFVELANRTGQDRSLDGYVIRRDGPGSGTFTVPAGTTLPAAGLRAFTATELGFQAADNDRLLLLAPGESFIADARIAQRGVSGRSPDATGPWVIPTIATPGRSNEVVRSRDVVINEILYHPRDTNATPWVELYNRSPHTVDLSNWRFTSGIDYRFPMGTALAADSYLVIAQDVAALRAAHPGIAVVGPFTNKLSRRADQLVLSDALGNPASEVHYFHGGRWPAVADGGGSSLELRNPWADNSVAEAWSASREPAAGWSNYTYRAVATSASEPTTWKEFVLGLIDAGECLIDDLSVVESPATTPVSLLQNGNFEVGAKFWRFLGTHRLSKVIPDPDQPGNHVLHLIATGPTEHMHNHLETTLINNRPIVNGRTYEISYRARALSGNRQLNTRLYFNRAARTTRLPASTVSGTPGARNSTYQANTGPTFTGFQHAPTVPNPNQVVTVSARVTDPQGVTSAKLYWSVNGGSWKSSDLAVSNPGLIAGSIPGGAAGNLVQFYLEATDALGAVATFPAAGPGSRALFVVNDRRAPRGLLHNLRLLMTPADTAFLHATTNVMSNEFLGATVVYDEQETFYNVGVHLQGSQRGRSDPGRVGYTINFDPEQLFRGVHDGVSIDRSGGYTGVGGDQDEIVLKHAVQHAGGLPGMYDDLIRVIPARPDLTGTGLLIMAKYGDVFLDSQFANGSEGGLFKLELIYSPTTTSGGNPQNPKLPQPDDVVGVDLGNRGDDPESYRWYFLHENQREQDDYRPLINLAKTLSKSGTALDTESQRYMDVSMWMRAVAFQSLWGLVDTYPFDNQHNFMVYFRPEDGRALPFLWDMDYNFGASATSPINRAVGNLAKVITLPGNQRLYQGHLLDLITTTYNTNYLSPWITHYGTVAGQNYSGIRSYIDQRVKSVRNQLPATVPFSVNGSSTPGLVETPSAVISGRAWINVRTLRLAGQSVPPEVKWNTTTSWQISVPVILGTNAFQILGYDFQGRLLASNTVVMTSTAVGGGSDIDADGLPDIWETAHGLNLAAADADLDPDRDGQSNRQEYLAGTDPHDPASVLKLEAQPSPEGIQLAFTARAGRSYTILARSALQDATWERVSDVSPEALDHRLVAAIPGHPGSARFYRLVTPKLP